MKDIDNEKNELDTQLEYIDKCHMLIKEKEEEYKRKLTACIVTFGCQMNFKDSEKLSGILTDIGYEIVKDEHADLVIYNTCTVRENANLRLYGRLGTLSSIKKENPNMLVALCGCMMQEPQVVEKINKSFPFVDIIFGTHNIFALARLLYERLVDGKKVREIWDDTQKIVESLPSNRKYSFKSGINIMYGCDNFCSYCIVPYVRGREKSRKPDDILNEARSLADDGVVEVMLLGQNVNSYGKKFENPVSFANLLKKVSEIDGIERIRFMTSHPKDLSDELIETIAGNKKICRHVHLPLQSGSSRILKLMNRHYSKEDYLVLVDKLRDAMPNISITTDIIVGFPGETEDDFNETMDVVEKVRYDSAFTFIYSKRSGTPAAEMKDQVPDDIVKDRFDRLLKKVNAIAKEKTGSRKGQVGSVLVEEQNSKLEGYLTGRLENNSIVHFKGDKSLIGKIVNVKLSEAKGFYYMGEMVE